MAKIDDLYSDKVRETKIESFNKNNKYSKYCDLIYYPSSVTPGITLAMLVYKPAKPSYILATTHGWHMSMPKFEENNDKPKDYLYIIVDMRGRAFSEGKQDCNGFELFDIYDACEYAKKHYSEYLINQDIIYFEGGSGGGGNAYELANKFPDYFAAIVAHCGITNYALWYKNDKVGEFQDEMRPWIGFTPDENPEAYASRSAINSITNLRSPLFMAHGSKDIRVPCYHARNYYEKVKEIGYKKLVKYWEIPEAGGQDHWTNISKKHEKKLGILSKKHLKNHRIPVVLEKKGNLIIPGFLVTKYFDIILDDINCIGEVEYDIENKIYNVKAPCKYNLKIKHRVRLI